MCISTRLRQSTPNPDFFIYAEEALELENEHLLQNTAHRNMRAMLELERKTRNSLILVTLL